MRASLSVGIVIASVSLIACELILVAYVYTSPWVTRGHRFYALKRTVEDWSPGYDTDESLGDIKWSLKKTIRRIREAQVLIKRSGDERTFGYLIPIVRADTDEVSTDTPLNATVQEAVQTIQEATHVANTLTDTDVFIESAQRIAETAPQGVETFESIAQDVGITASAETMGAVAQGIEEFSTLQERAADATMETVQSLNHPGTPIEHHIEIVTPTTTYEGIQADLLATQEQVKHLDAELQTRGIISSASQEIMHRAEALVSEAERLFTEGDTEQARLLVQQANALIEHADAFVPSEPTVQEDVMKAELPVSTTPEVTQFDTTSTHEEQAQELTVGSQREVVNGLRQYGLVKDQTKRLMHLLSHEDRVRVEQERANAQAFLQSAQAAARAKQWDLAGQRSREALQLLTRIQNIFLHFEQYNVRSSPRDTSQALPDDGHPYRAYDGTSVGPAWVSVKEWMDGQDVELIVSDVSNSSFAQITNNETDDRAPSLRDGWLVWQTLTPAGWEIMALQQGHMPTRITQDEFDDVSPMTDGRYVIWQKNLAHGSVIYISDVAHGEIRPISPLESSAQDPQFVGQEVRWREWVDDTWRVQTFRLPERGSTL